jgi:hypothetical protein
MSDEYGGNASSVNVEIPEIYQEVFESIKHSIPLLDGDYADIPHQAKKLLIEKRKDAADKIAVEVSKLLVEQMERNYTRRGIPINFLD